MRGNSFAASCLQQMWSIQGSICCKRDGRGKEGDKKDHGKKVGYKEEDIHAAWS
jgi:hypothetical protein